MAREVPLAVEIINQIVSYVSYLKLSVSVLSCTLVCKAWYLASINHLYFDPFLRDENIDRFVKTICPPQNAPQDLQQRAHHLAAMVRCLGLDGLKKSAGRITTIQLLERLKGNLEKFKAPPLSFTTDSFLALSKCQKLNFIDLSSISKSVSCELFFRTINSLPELETLFLPRRFTRQQEVEIQKNWPSRLETLHIKGGIDGPFLITKVAFPPDSLSRISIAHCSKVDHSSIVFTLNRIGSQLTHLLINHPMEMISHSQLDFTLRICPSLVFFFISSAFVTNNLFKDLPVNHKLRALDINSPGHPSPILESSVITSRTILDTINQGLLPNLRRVRYSKYLGWDKKDELRSDIRTLSDAICVLELLNPLYEPCAVQRLND